MDYRIFFIIISIVSFGALSTAFIAQYGFHLAPCAFCLYERYPYAIAFVLSLVGLWKSSLSSFLKKCLILCFLIEAGITTYHVLIEHHWVSPPSSCVSKFDMTEDTTVADLEAQMDLAARIVRCDVVPLKILGLSLAEYNLLFSIFLVLFCSKRFLKKEKTNLLK